MKQSILLLLVVLVGCGNHQQSVPAGSPNEEARTEPTAPQKPGPPRGVDVGNGGDPVAADIVARGYFLLNYLESHLDQKILSQEETDLFRKALVETAVELVDEELKDIHGRGVVAIVIPDPKTNGKLIKVNRKGWKESIQQGLNMVRFVFHEYLRVIEKDDDNFKVSIKLNMGNEDYEGTSGIYEYMAVFRNITRSMDEKLAKGVLLAHVELNSYVAGISTHTVRVGILRSGVVLTYRVAIDPLPKILGKLSPEALEWTKKTLEGLPNSPLEGETQPTGVRKSVINYLGIHSEGPVGIQQIGFIYNEQVFLLPDQKGLNLIKLLDGFLNLALMR